MEILGANKRHKMRDRGLSLYATGVSGGKLNLLGEYLIPGSTLDVGSGNGLYGLHAVKLGSKVLQIDVEDRRDARAQHLPFRIMDAQRLELPDASYDNVVAFDIMEHLDDDVMFLREVRRVCRGRLLLSVPNAEDDQPGKVFLTHMHHKDKTHRREYTKEMLLDTLNRAGFRVLTIQPNLNPFLPFFAHALAREGFFSKVAARIISLECQLLERLGLFENRCVGDWFCVAELSPG